MSFDQGIWNEKEVINEAEMRFGELSTSVNPFRKYLLIAWKSTPPGWLYWLESKPAQPLFP